MDQTFGFADRRVSTADHHSGIHLDALQKFGCDRIFQEKISGLSVQRPVLDEMPALLPSGDTVVVSRFTRLGRSDHLINLIGSSTERASSSKRWIWVSARPRPRTRWRSTARISLKFIDIVAGPPGGKKYNFGIVV